MITTCQDLAPAPTPEEEKKGQLSWPKVLQPGSFEFPVAPGNFDLPGSLKGPRSGRALLAEEVDKACFSPTRVVMGPSFKVPERSTASDVFTAEEEATGTDHFGDGVAMPTCPSRPTWTCTFCPPGIFPERPPAVSCTLGALSQMTTVPSDGADPMLRHSPSPKMGPVMKWLPLHFLGSPSRSQVQARPPCEGHVPFKSQSRCPEWPFVFLDIFYSAPWLCPPHLCL